MVNKKAVANVVGIVLAAGIAIALVTSAYLWGSQILDKRDATTKFLVGKNFMDSVQNEIENIVNNQGGEVSLNIPGGSVGLVDYDGTADGNNIIYTFDVNQPLVLEGGQVRLDVTSYADFETGTELGTFGESSPGILTIKSTSTSQGFLVDLKLHFRELLTSETSGVLIALEEGGISSEGESRISLSYGGTEPATIGGREVQKFIVNVDVS